MASLAFNFTKFNFGQSSTTVPTITEGAYDGDAPHLALSRLGRGIPPLSIPAASTKDYGPSPSPWGPAYQPGMT